MMNRRSSSIAAPERPRLMPPAQIALFGLLLLLALYLVHAGPDLPQRLQGASFSDPLSLAYLNAWLRAEPENDGLRLRLAEHQARNGRLDLARTTLAPLLGPAGATRGHHVEAEALALDILNRALWRHRPGTPGFVQARRAVLAQMERLAVLPLEPPQLVPYARQAVALGAPELALRFYRRRLASGLPLGMPLYAEIARLQLGLGRYREAAATCLRGMEHATGRAEQRRLFLTALGALQSGNLLPEALAAAERHGRPLADDPETLRFLTRLARRANRPDLAERYVTRLLSPRRAAEERP